MKTKIIYSLLLLLIIPAIAFSSSTDPQGKYTKEKRIKKEFKVNRDAKLQISNSYGNVNMVSWNENRIVIEVVVKTNGNDEDKVQDKLDEIEVLFEGGANFVGAKTTFSRGSSRSWWNSWKSSSVNMEINYTIKLPVTNTIDISNDYGSISLDRIEGNAMISCDYGKLNLGELMGDHNYLNFDYTKNSTIGYMKNGRINADYSGFKLEKGGGIELNADYSKSEFGDIKSLNYVCDYGSIKTENSGKVTGRGDYLTASLGKVHGEVTINADYGSLRIEELSSDAGNVTIQSEFTGIKIGYHPEYNFTFDIKLEYAGLTGKENLSFKQENSRQSEKYYEGYYGSANARNFININSEYGGVTLSKN